MPEVFHLTSYSTLTTLTFRSELVLEIHGPLLYAAHRMHGGEGHHCRSPLLPPWSPLSDDKMCVVRSEVHMLSAGCRGDLRDDCSCVM
jgi:hypothetical protein